MIRKIISCSIFLLLSLDCAAKAFKVTKMLQLPIEIGNQDFVTLSFVVRNLEESIGAQALDSEGSETSTMLVEKAERLLKRDSARIVFPFGVDITRNDKGVVSVDEEPALHVIDVKAWKKNPIFPKNEDTEISVTVGSNEVVTQPTTYSYTAYLRFYDGQCAFKRHGKYESVAKNAACIVYSLPVGTQNVRILPPPKPVSGWEEAHGLSGRPPRKFSDGPKGMFCFANPDDEKCDR